MSPILSLALFSFNVLTFFLSLSVLMLALWQNPGTPVGRALNAFLASLVFLNFSVALVLANELFFGIPILIQITTYLSAAAFALSSITAFYLVVTSAGLMKQALQVIARAGLIYVVVMQWPLWTGRMFAPEPDPALIMNRYGEAGIVAAVGELVIICLALYIAWRYRRRIGQPALVFSISLLLVGQAFTLVIAPLRLINLPSLSVSLVSGILGYSLVRLQIFNPLMMRTAQLSAVRDLSQAMARRQSLQDVLDAVAHQTRSLLNCGMALVLLVDHDGKLIVVAQNGGSTRLIGRKLAAGEGLAGRVLQTQQTMNVANYRSWDGRSPVFSDQMFFASMSVPLIDGDEMVGVINVHELEGGRIYTERDRVVIEMLVAQATLGITHTRLHYAVDYWRLRARAADKSAPPPIRFDETGRIVETYPSDSGEAPTVTVADLIAMVLKQYDTGNRALAVQITPGSSVLPVRVTTLQKVIGGALDQVIDQANDDDDILINAQTDEKALLLEVSRYLHNDRQQPLDSVRIRLEKEVYVST